MCTSGTVIGRTGVHGPDGNSDEHYQCWYRMTGWRPITLSLCMFAEFVATVLALSTALLLICVAFYCVRVMMILFRCYPSGGRSIVSQLVCMLQLDRANWLVCHRAPHRQRPSLVFCIPIAHRCSHRKSDIQKERERERERAQSTITGTRQQQRSYAEESDCDVRACSCHHHHSTFITMAS